jgi:hypothetical protein
MLCNNTSRDRYMQQQLTQSVSDLVRTHVREVYLKPVIQRGESTLTVNAGAVHKALALHNRVPLVCAALKSKKFLEGNGLRLVSKTGPPSGQSTTVTFTYEILASSADRPSVTSPLIDLRGVAKNLFRELGGGENFIRSERNLFAGRREK